MSGGPCENWRDALAAALAHPAVSGIPAAAVDGAAVRLRLERFTELLLAGSRTYGLISVGDSDDPCRLVVRHVVESMLAWRELARAPDGPLVDLGSGAGLPGIPLAIAIGRDRPVVLVERKEKRVRFLHEAVEALHLDHVTVHLGDAAELAGRSQRCAAGMVVFRAFLPSDRRLANVLRRSFAGGTRVVAYKAGDAEREAALLAQMDEVEPASIRVIRLDAPLQDATRTLVCFTTR